MSFYLKYRPQTVSELDNKLIRESLPSLLRSRNFTHAFLFTGPKGTGKTSAARIIAKTVNCLFGGAFKKEWKFSEPCNKCEVCLSITRGINLDVLEIDAASNRGIDEIRALREKIGFAPTSSKFKVYIIDEVHMLTTEAFNALLKTLEEPPSHVVFILCTTERHKIPETIISRCTSIAFSKAGKDELIRSLKRVVKGEELTVSEEALEKIAEVADGSFRDAVKTMEQVVSLCHKKIEKEDVMQVLSLGQVKEKEIVALLLKRDGRATVNLINLAIEKGSDPKLISRLILSEFHRLLVNKLEEKEGGKSEFKDLQKAISLFSRADNEIKYSPVPQLPLEVAVIEYCFENK